MSDSAFSAVLEMAGHRPHRNAQEKVAILLLSLGNPLGPKLLQNLSAGDVKAVMESASTLGTIDRDDLESLVDDFAAQFAKALGIDTGLQTVRNLVEQAFSADQLASMLGSSPLAVVEPVWGKFQGGSENLLAPYLLDEHPQTAAFILSNLDPDVAARCLATLPREMREAAAKRLLDLRPVTDRASRLLQDCLQEDLLVKAEQGGDQQGVIRLATLMNRLDREQQAAMLEAIAASRPDAARELRGLVFSFEDIERLLQPARLTLFDKVPTEQVIPALRGMPAGFKEAVLSALSARSKRMVEAELQNDNGQVAKEGLAARRTIADLALQLAQRGEIALPKDE